MMRQHKTKKIIFTDVIGVSKEYAPKPAIKFIPEWYKKMEASFPKKVTPDSVLTIKKCIPVLDSITAGYIIVSPCDVYVSLKDDEPNYHSPIPSLIQFHPRKQAYAHPNANEYPFPKWTNPWAIKTPQGYSCLFKPPAHNSNPWFEILEGVVDTDAYSAAVNFPFVLKNPADEFMIPAGTPIAQVIPFKREEWKLSLSDDVKSPQSVSSYLNSRIFDRYKRMFWSRKSYL